MLLLLVLCIFNIIDARPRNVLFVMVDDLRPALGLYKKQYVTPYIDEFSKSSVVFHRAYAQQSLCAPSRNSLLTGRRPDTTKLYDFYSYWRDVAGNFTTLPQYLKQNGYHTYSLGKIFHPGESSNFTDDFPHSWSEPAWHPPTEVYKDSPVCGSPGDLHSNLVCPVDVAKQPGGTLPDIETTAKAVQFLKNATEPFFLAVGYHKPHVPLKYPVEYQKFYPLDSIELPEVRSYPPGLPTVAWNPFSDLRERDDIQSLNVSFPYGQIPDEWARKIKQSYLSCVTFIDHLFGQLVQTLKASHLYDNTVVVLLGDHGWSLGEHGEWAKFSNFDVALRTPLIIRATNLTGNRSVYNVVELVDVFQTIVDILDLPALPTCPPNSSAVALCSEGVSLRPLLLGQRGSKRMAFSQYPRPGLVPTKHPNSDRPRLKEIRLMGYSVRSDRYRYTLWLPWDPTTFSADWAREQAAELYDHAHDLHENLNLAGNRRVKRVERKLRRHLERQFRRNRLTQSEVEETTIVDRCCLAPI